MREIPASTLLELLLDRIQAEADRAVEEAARSEAELRGIDLATSRFDPNRRVWIVPDAPDGE